MSFNKIQGSLPGIPLYLALYTTVIHHDQTQSLYMSRLRFTILGCSTIVETGELNRMSFSKIQCNLKPTWSDSRINGWSTLLLLFFKYLFLKILNKDFLVRENFHDNFSCDEVSSF